jgi:pyruvate formate lyase activating enzyme
LPFIDAMNIDLKSIRPDFYKNICDGNLNTVKKTIETSFKVCHVELTNLLVTGLNDSFQDIKELVDYVASLSPEIPLHFSRYFPQYRLDAPPTPEEKLFMAYNIGRERLKYVYLGNIWGENGSNTYCPECNHLLIQRVGYTTKIKGLSGKNCARCGREINIIL